MNFDALVVSDAVVEVLVDHSICDIYILGEHLVEVIPKLVGSHIRVDC